MHPSLRTYTGVHRILFGYVSNKRINQSSRGMAFPPQSGARKINNIWGSVVQEQCQESVAAELGVFGMEGGVSMASRSVETYNYVLARKMMEKEREEEEKVF